MGKKWIRYYLLFGTVLMIILSALCSFTFVKSNVDQIQEKTTFESIYKDTSIDFIIPSPSYSQVGEIEQDSETGIKVITPYYETTAAAEINGISAKGTTIIIPDADKVQYTPYVSSRIISGSNEITAGCAIADRTFVVKNGCDIGDTITISISGKEYAFTISGIAETNTYYNEGTVAVVLTEEQADRFINDGLKYSAAYVLADDYEKCKDYLYNEYKPYGRLKDRTEFDDVNTYDQHTQNFETADWTKEITNCRDNYSSLSVKYDNVETSVIRNMFIAAMIIFFAVIVFNNSLLRQEELKRFMQGFLVKKSGTISAVKNFYRKGILLNTAVFCISTVLLYWWISLAAGNKIISTSVLTSLVMIAVQFVSSLIMIVVSRGYVGKIYTIKPKNSNVDSKTATDIQLQDVHANSEVKPSNGNNTDIDSLTQQEEPFEGMNSVEKQEGENEE